MAFKLVVAKASEFLSEKNPWKIREALKREARLRSECGRSLDKLMGYVRTLEKGGLNIVEVHGDDIHRLPSFVRETGVLNADCLHLIVMDRLGIREIGTIDSSFNTIKNLRVIP
ncbi:MAG TPA: hypothetical protein VNA15_03030 [Candidatus Angelobacter sp.]|nr:hypothetical protein [Candidatus Angelobacter sp.]